MRERSWFLMHQQCGFALLQRHFSSAAGQNDLWAEIHDRLDRVLAVSARAGVRFNRAAEPARWAM